TTTLISVGTDFQGNSLWTTVADLLLEIQDGVQQILHAVICIARIQYRTQDNLKMFKIIKALLFALPNPLSIYIATCINIITSISKDILYLFWSTSSLEIAVQFAKIGLGALYLLYRK
ncbi:hypothetical protein ACJX0J_019481, partial [Zea mays]